MAEFDLTAGQEPDSPDQPFNLIDGATGTISEVARQFDDQRRIASNPDLSLEERLEAFEDIFDSEVGNTNLVRARNIEYALEAVRQPGGRGRCHRSGDAQLCGFDSPKGGIAGAAGIHGRFDCLDEPTHARTSDE